MRLVSICISQVAKIMEMARKWLRLTNCSFTWWVIFLIESALRNFDQGIINQLQTYRNQPLKFVPSFLVRQVSLLCLTVPEDIVCILRGDHSRENAQIPRGGTGNCWVWDSQAIWIRLYHTNKHFIGTRPNDFQLRNNNRSYKTINR